MVTKFASLHLCWATIHHLMDKTNFKLQTAKLGWPTSHHVIPKMHVLKAKLSCDDGTKNGTKAQKKKRNEGRFAKTALLQNRPNSFPLEQCRCNDSVRVTSNPMVTKFASLLLLAWPSLQSLAVKKKLFFCANFGR